VFARKALLKSTRGRIGATVVVLVTVVEVKAVDGVVAVVVVVVVSRNGFVATSNLQMSYFFH
jgi:hypothetical protein